MGTLIIYATEIRNHRIEIDDQLFSKDELHEFVTSLENGYEDQLFDYISDNTVEDADIDFDDIEYKG